MTMETTGYMTRGEHHDRHMMCSIPSGIRVEFIATA